MFFFTDPDVKWKDILVCYGDWSSEWHIFDILMLWYAVVYVVKDILEMTVVVELVFYTVSCKARVVHFLEDRRVLCWQWDWFRTKCKHMTTAVNNIKHPRFQLWQNVTSPPRTESSCTLLCSWEVWIVWRNRRILMRKSVWLLGPELSVFL